MGEERFQRFGTVFDGYAGGNFVLASNLPELFHGLRSPLFARSRPAGHPFRRRKTELGLFGAADRSSDDLADEPTGARER